TRVARRIRWVGQPTYRTRASTARVRTLAGPFDQSDTWPLWAHSVEGSAIAGLERTSSVLAWRVIRRSRSDISWHRVVRREPRGREPVGRQLTGHEQTAGASTDRRTVGDFGCDAPPGLGVATLASAR